MKFLNIYKKIGVQPMKTTAHDEAVVYINNKEYWITSMKYKKGKLIGFEAVENKNVSCRNCIFLNLNNDNPKCKYSNCCDIKDYDKNKKLSDRTKYKEKEI